MSASTTVVRERPVFCAGPMVRAALAGKKTQMRRVIRPQPQWADHAGEPESDWYLEWCHARTGCLVWEWRPGEPMPEEMIAACPHGRVGDRLWVRETWRGWLAGDFPCIDYWAGGGDENGCNFPGPGYDIEHPCFVDWKWRSAIHMPRWASRLTLELTGVRVERLQEITEADALAEGVENYFWGCYFDDYLSMPAAVANYRRLWDEKNGKRPGCSWYDNPWAWVLSFRVISQSGCQLS